MSFLQNANQSRDTDFKLEDITGVGPATASKLYDAGIDTVDKLAASSVNKLVAIGIQRNIAETAINNAQVIANKRAEQHQPSSLPTANNIPVEEAKIDAVMLNGKRVEVTDEDHSNADLVGMHILDWMALDKETQYRAVRIEKAKMPPEQQPQIIPHDYDDYELGTMEVNEFLSKRQQAEIEDQRAKKIQGMKLQMATQKFAADIVHGEPVPNMYTPEPGTTDLDTEIYRPNLRHRKKTQKQANRERDDSVRAVIDNMLG